VQGEGKGCDYATRSLTRIGRISPVKCFGCMSVTTCKMTSQHGHLRRDTTTRQAATACVAQAAPQCCSSTRAVVKNADGHCYQEKCCFGKVSRMTADGDPCDGSDFNHLLHPDESFLLVASCCGPNV
jgi:hypothetical protein